jgi:hypothetical protein
MEGEADPPLGVVAAAAAAADLPPLPPRQRMELDIEVVEIKRYHPVKLWSNYDSTKRVYCACDACYRCVLCGPCTLVSCTLCLPFSCFLYACAWCEHNCDGNKIRYEDVAYNCCCFNALVAGGPVCAHCCVGLVRFESKRSEEEKRAISKAQTCARDIVCCPCDA